MQNPGKDLQPFIEAEKRKEVPNIAKAFDHLTGMIDTLSKKQTTGAKAVGNLVLEFPQSFYQRIRADNRVQRHDMTPEIETGPMTLMTLANSETSKAASNRKSRATGNPSTTSKRSKKE
eukprot:TRINITY_DN5439_c0_g1_i1.p1 TRINITY_DN5439_c0_g1~~TRINITY_DN5439_c0_g1_i1.p1  ORF type:complete len:119 (+),score=20.81 TRINITY_DN5439_c0_g1_i1:120-476(+)